MSLQPVGNPQGDTQPADGTDLASGSYNNSFEPVLNGQHTEYAKVTIRNAKCDMCKTRNSTCMQQCKRCGWTTCYNCHSLGRYDAHHILYTLNLDWSSDQDEGQRKKRGRSPLDDELGHAAQADIAQPAPKRPVANYLVSQHGLVGNTSLSAGGGGVQPSPFGAPLPTQYGNGGNAPGPPPGIATPITYGVGEHGLVGNTSLLAGGGGVQPILQPSPFGAPLPTQYGNRGNAPGPPPGIATPITYGVGGNAQATPFQAAVLTPHGYRYYAQGFPSSQAGHVTAAPTHDGMDIDNGYPGTVSVNCWVPPAPPPSPGTVRDAMLGVEKTSIDFCDYIDREDVLRRRNDHKYYGYDERINNHGPDAMDTSSDDLSECEMPANISEYKKRWNHEAFPGEKVDPILRLLLEGGVRTIQASNEAHGPGGYQGPFTFMKSFKAAILLNYDWAQKNTAEFERQWKAIEQYVYLWNQDNDILLERLRTNESCGLRTLKVMFQLEDLRYGLPPESFWTFWDEGMAFALKDQG
ncbi:hypothetical protein F4861DRAFT_144290 [Xylaria intraflava]|nr:hypothetical protein F4861DRAFT_144290 [Xylaria intraflava]